MSYLIYKKLFNIYMEHPYYWIVNPIYREYNSVHKKLCCITCELKLNNKKHNIQTILYDEKEKKRQFELQKKKLLKT